jgi:hypothetical protein
MDVRAAERVLAETRSRARFASTLAPCRAAWLRERRLALDSFFLFSLRVLR